MELDISQKKLLEFIKNSSRKDRSFLDAALCIMSYNSHGSLHEDIFYSKNFLNDIGSNIPSFPLDGRIPTKTENKKINRFWQEAYYNFVLQIIEYNPEAAKILLEIIDDLKELNKSLNKKYHGVLLAYF